MIEITLDVDSTEDWPVTLDMIKDDLRIAHDALDDVIMGQYLPAAISRAERFMRRSILQKTHRWILRRFPWAGSNVLYLPRGKVQSVTSIEYSDAGSTVTLYGPSSSVSPPGTDYQEDLRGHQARVMPNRGEAWPATDSDVLSPVVVTFVAGWADVSLVPEDIKRGLIVLVADAMEVPGPAHIPDNYDADFAEKLLSGWRILA